MLKYKSDYGMFLCFSEAKATGTYQLIIISTNLKHLLPCDWKTGNGSVLIKYSAHYQTILLLSNRAADTTEASVCSKSLENSICCFFLQSLAKASLDTRPIPGWANLSWTHEVDLKEKKNIYKGSPFELVQCTKTHIWQYLRVGHNGLFFKTLSS